MPPSDDPFDSNAANEAAGQHWIASTVKLVPGKSDKELADEVRKKVKEAIAPMLAIFTEAKAKGFDVSYMIQMDGLGRAYLHSLKIMKEY